jgi:hypothetical protein
MKKAIQMWMVTNPFSGESVVLTTEQKDMYVKIMELQKDINGDADLTSANKSRNSKIREFDGLRNEFSDRWRKEYYALID